MSHRGAHPPDGWNADPCYIDGVEGTCPGCGAPLPTPVFDMGVIGCSACGTCSVRTGGVLTTVGGEAPVVAVRSPLVLGRRGSIAGRAAEVVGRTQLDYGEGVFDEWTVRFEDGAVAWVQEDEGEFVVHETRRHGPGSPPSLRVGAQVDVLGARLFVQELGEARIRSVRGQSDLAWAPRRTLAYAAGRVEQDEAIALFSDGEIVLAHGHEVAPNDLRFGVGAR